MSHTHYIKDEYNESYRIWKSSDPGDVFEMLPLNQFHEDLFKKLGFVEGFPEDDEGNTICPQCLKEKQKPPIWIRTCQECGHKQPSKPIPEFTTESWKYTKCRKCKSSSLDYGSYN